MKFPTLLSSVALMLTLLLSCSKDVPVGSQDDIFNTTEIKAIEDSYTTNATLDIINNYRLEKGLSTLLNNEIIYKEASDHTDYMIYRGETSHDYFYEREAFLKERLAAVQVGENVAYAFNSSEAVLNAWLKSEIHRSNIEGDFTHFGVSVKKNSEGRLFYTSILVGSY